MDAFIAPFPGGSGVVSSVRAGSSIRLWPFDIAISIPNPKFSFIFHPFSCSLSCELFCSAVEILDQRREEEVTEHHPCYLPSKIDE
jgi:hypothetical protein